MAAAPRAAQWFTTADGTRHPLIEVSSDSSDDDVVAGGSCDALAPLDPAAAPEQRRQVTQARMTSVRQLQGRQVCEVIQTYLLYVEATSA